MFLWKKEKVGASRKEGHVIYRIFHRTPTLKRNMRKNMKIPRNKEKSKQPIEPSLNPLEAVKQKGWKEVVMKNNVCEKL
jgi:hypothetical protein